MLSAIPFMRNLYVLLSLITVGRSRAKTERNLKRGLLAIHGSMHGGGRPKCSQPWHLPLVQDPECLRSQIRGIYPPSPEAIHSDAPQKIA